MGAEETFHCRLLLVDRAVGVYEKGWYVLAGYNGYGYPSHKHEVEYLLVRGPVFLPNKADEGNIISVHETKAEALTALERLAQAQFQGESEETSKPSPQPQGKEISGHRASSMPRGSGILYAAKNRNGFDPRDYNGVVVVTDTGRPYWASVWHRKVNGRAALEIQLSPKV